MNFLTKLGITTITAGAITLGAMTYFDGSETLESAKQTVTDFAQKINVYEANETALVGKITDLKTEREALISELELLEGEQLAEAQQRIEELESQITTLEEQLTTSEVNANDLAERIVQLEAEVTKANEETAELQAVLDENQVDAQPLTEEELTSITEDEDEDPYTLSYKYGDEPLTIIPGITLSSKSSQYELENDSGEDAEYNFVPGGTMSALYDNNYKLIGLSAEVIYLIANGETYTIYVSK